MVYALLIAGVFRTLFFQPFWIPSASMKDTLLIGDFLFVNKMAYGYSRCSCPFVDLPDPGPHLRLRAEARRCGGVPPPGERQDYIKRLIGLPGDTVQVKDGVLYINGVEAQAGAGGRVRGDSRRRRGRTATCRAARGWSARAPIASRTAIIETLPDGAEA